MNKFSIHFWNSIHAIVVILSLLLSFYFGSIHFLCWPVFLSFIYLIGAGYPSSINLPNSITFFRFILIVVAMLLVMYLTDIQFFAIMCAAVLLDVVDGYIARQLAKESELGFYLDMEVDAFFVLIMAMYFYQYGDVGIWILIPGMMRYLFKMVQLLFPKPSFVESKKSYASIIAGTYFVINLIAIVASLDWRRIILVIGGLAIIGSFGISFIEYFRWTKK